eukprot:gene18194-21673_t
MVMCVDIQGLGKTIQTIAYIGLVVDRGCKVPHLVVAPLSVLRNWEREFATWVPHLNVVTYSGNAYSREVIRKYEFYTKQPTGNQALAQSKATLQDVQNACHEFPGLAHKLRHFQRNHVSTTDQPQDEGLRHGVRAEWSIVDRIIAQRSKKKSRQYLVKWKELSHEECTWEPVADLVGFEAEIQRFHSIRPIAEELGKEKGTGRGKARSREGRAKAKAGKTVKTFTKLDKQPEFMAGGELHPYQLEGLNWLTFAWQTKKHVILADDMVSKDLAGAP